MYRSKCLKQADVLELMLLFPQEFSREQMEIAYEYYEPITTHDSSLSASTHAIIGSWINKNEEANKFLKEVIKIDMSVEKLGAAEGIHIANCGGFWQMIVYGFAGLKSGLFEKEIMLEPNLPDAWNSIEFQIVWHNRNYKIKVTKNDYAIEQI